MHTIKLNIQDNVFDKVIYFLQNLPKNEVEIVEEQVVLSDTFSNDIELFTDHSANLVEEWKDSSEDAVWK